jgi:hypothetical protein
MARLLSVVGLESVRFISVSLPLRLLGGKSSDDYLVIDRIVQSTLHASNGRFNKILLTNGRRIDRLHLVCHLRIGLRDGSTPLIRLRPAMTSTSVSTPRQS